MSSGCLGPPSIQIGVPSSVRTSAGPPTVTSNRAAALCAHHQMSSPDLASYELCQISLVSRSRRKVKVAPSSWGGHPWSRIG